MVVTEYKREPVERKIKGVKRKVEQKARSFHYKLNSVTGSIRYLIKAKKGKDSVENVIDRASYIITNCDFINPTFLAGTPEHDLEVERQAKSVNDQMLENHLKWASKEEIEAMKAIQNMEGITDEERAKAIKAYYAYELVMSFKPTEFPGMDREQKAKVMTELYYEFIKDFSNSKEIDRLHFGVLQFDTDNPHNQFFLTKYDNNGNKLDLHNNYERMQQFIAKMENHPYYGQFLEKVVSQVMDKKKLPKTMEEKFNLQKEIQNCISKDPFAFEETHKNLIQNKIKLIPEFNGNKLKEVMIHRQGSKPISSLGLDKEYHIALSRYFELKKLGEKHKKYPLAEKLLKAKEIIKNNPNLDIESLDELLNVQGFGITANQAKNGTINGYSLVIIDLQETIKMSTLAITKKEINCTTQAAANVRKKYKEYLDETDVAGKVEYVAGEPVFINSLGQSRPLFKKRKRIPDYPSLFEYMADNGGKFEIALKTKFSLRGDTFYRGTVEKIRIIEQSPDNLKTSVLGSDRTTAKAVAQLYLDSGYKGFKIVDGGQDETSKNLWREGSLLGLKVDGYKPTEQDLAWLLDQLKPKVQEARDKNIAAIESYNADGRAFEIKVVSNQWLKVNHTPIAYAFVDLMKAGLDPMMVLNPPRKNGSKATEDDLKAHYKLILEVVQNECPEHLEEAKRLLEPYKTVKLIKPEWE
ncbi:TPA: hypothetical protein NIE67_000750 [Pseudomonas aeruginosa]|nr:hypothetical protein [Pseudomonas aeruginosa]